MIRLRFSGDGPHLTFVEAENERGEGINVGRWVRDGEYSILELPSRPFEEYDVHICDHGYIGTTCGLCLNQAITSEIAWSLSQRR